MFSKILIANRGEISLRIIRACKELGVRTVAVFSNADKYASFVHLADESVCIGPSASSDSYLKMERIIAAAEITDAEAIHPGYGFLAENPEFAEICEACNIKFIGPSPQVIRLMGDKNNARITMSKIGVQVVPGSKDILKDEKEALKIAHEIGFPVIIKASAGGGGKGMRVAHTDIALSNAFFTAKAEAEKAFGNSDVYIEKYIDDPRHIEIQVLADEHNNVVHLGERECSIQRRHQKLIEESPSPIVTKEIRDKMGKAAVSAAKSVNY
ncbi:acetyl-CoA carboxylase biotin carboxylase subunit, partial [Candidatus Dependentiae bacterium]|nr:acetyl-CoA carboxylase biotin carboxylase subunit [Candidatus Dependentiae bacterium]